jgi:hypothetical protein
VLTYDDFRQDNLATVRRILRFLNVDDAVDIPMVEANPSYRVRFPRAQRMIDQIGEGRGSALKKAIMPITTQRWRRRLLFAFRDSLVHAVPGPPDGRLMQELRLRYASEVVGLGESLGRDLFTEWGYARRSA